MARGHDVTRTPNEWMPLDADDETQLLGAIACGRCILTFNIADFVRHSRRHPYHAGIITAHQSWTLSETEAEDLIGQVRWLNEWRR